MMKNKAEIALRALLLGIPITFESGYSLVYGDPDDSGSKRLYYIGFNSSLFGDVYLPDSSTSLDYFISQANKISDDQIALLVANITLKVNKMKED
jgi:hypothetical protein